MTFYLLVPCRWIWIGCHHFFLAGSHRCLWSDASLAGMSQHSRRRFRGWRSWIKKRGRPDDSEDLSLQGSRSEDWGWFPKNIELSNSTTKRNCLVDILMCSIDFHTRSWMKESSRSCLQFVGWYPPCCRSQGNLVSVPHLAYKCHEALLRRQDWRSAVDNVKER